VPEFDARQSAHTHQSPDRAFAGLQDLCCLLGRYKLWTFFSLRVAVWVPTFTNSLYGLLLSAGNTRIGLQDRLNCSIRRWLHSIFTWFLGPPCSKPTPSAPIRVICGSIFWILTTGFSHLPSRLPLHISHLPPPIPPPPPTGANNASTSSSVNATLSAFCSCRMLSANFCFRSCIPCILASTVPTVRKR
jgi:hypothetical protein